MVNILDQIFQDKKFICMKELSNQERNDVENEKTLLRRVYINDYDEMYFVVEGELSGDTLTDILGICAEIEENSEIRKCYKSNWVLILLTPIIGELSWEQRKKILLIEENKYFCRKYVLWYDDKEKSDLEELCQGNYSIKNINSIIENYTYFSSFKNSDNKGYEVLSRIFIKLPYMSLNSLETTDKTIADFVRKKINDIHPELFEKLEIGDADVIEKYVTLSDKEKSDIEKKIAVLTKEKK